ncbi:MAG: peptidyl-prolyl cis-trans isomerase [Proteobacteria bacterium]|nr:peptidyl-prolyl cis-trans isomerase [Pseudomonadota bacterium]
MRQLLLRLPLAVLAFGLVSAGPAMSQRAADDPNEVVGRVGNAEIKLGQVRDFLRAADPNVRLQAEKDPQVLNRLVRNELGRLAVLAEARDKKWDQRPEVQAQLEAARLNVILGSYLQSVVQMPPGFPSDAEIQAAYETNKGNLMKPGEYRLAQIFLSVPASADKGVTDAVQRRADELVRKARTKGTDFAALARESSDHKESAVGGGDLGWLGAQNLLPEVRNAVGFMAKNEISAAIRSPNGFHIVKMIDSKPSVVAPLAEVREALIQTLRQRRAEELQAAYLNGMLERGGLAINEVALRKAVAPQ